MDFGRSFTYMFKQDGGFGKIIIGGLLLFIPIIGWAIVAGYALRTLQSVASGNDRLPEWTDWGDLIVKGFLLWVAGFIYYIPGIVLSFFGDVGSALSGLWGIVFIAVFPAAVTRFAASGGDFAAFFQFNEIFDFIQRNASNYVLAVLLGIVAGIIAGFGWILLIIGIVFTLFWAYLVYAHLFGSVYRASFAPAGRAGAYYPPPPQPPAPFQQPPAPGQYPPPPAPGQYQQPPYQQPPAPPAPPQAPPQQPPYQQPPAPGQYPPPQAPPQQPPYQQPPAPGQYPPPPPAPGQYQQPPYQQPPAPPAPPQAPPQQPPTPEPPAPASEQASPPTPPAPEAPAPEAPEAPPASASTDKPAE